MGLAFGHLKVYVRAGLAIASAATIGVVLFQNRANTVAFWFFGLTDEAEPINVVWLIVWTAISTMIAWWVSSFGWGIWRDLREVRQRKAKDALAKTHKQRADALDEQERRINEKVRQAIADDSEAGN